MNIFRISTPFYICVTCLFFSTIAFASPWSAICKAQLETENTQLMISDENKYQLLVKEGLSDKEMISQEAFDASEISNGVYSIILASSILEDQKTVDGQDIDSVSIVADCDIASKRFLGFKTRLITSKNSFHFFDIKSDDAKVIVKQRPLVLRSENASIVESDDADPEEITKVETLSLTQFSVTASGKVEYEGKSYQIKASPKFEMITDYYISCDKNERGSVEYCSIVSRESAKKLKNSNPKALLYPGEPMIYGNFEYNPISANMHLFVNGKGVPTNEEYVNFHLEVNSYEPRSAWLNDFIQSYAAFVGISVEDLHKGESLEAFSAAIPINEVMKSLVRTLDAQALRNLK